jgi:nucleotide-binding universal stress UspA family protein
MCAVEITLAIFKPHALIFVLVVLGVGLGARLFTKWYLPKRLEAKKPRPEEIAPTEEKVPSGEITLAQFATPADELDLAKPHIMVATRGGKRLLDFAVNYTKQSNGLLFVIYVRQLNVAFGPDRAPTFGEDRDAHESFAAAFDLARKNGVGMVPIYVVSSDVAESILDFAATYNASALLMGVSRTGAVLRALRGDVLTKVADNLPQDIPLLIHA